MTLYLLDTNAVSDMIALQPLVARHISDRLAAGDTLGLCRPVHYEVLRGLLWRNAAGKLHIYQRRVVPLLIWVEMIQVDWDQAARFWAEARRRGRQLGDPDLFLAALTHREGAILVSSDTDFDALPVRREDWRV